MTKPPTPEHYQRHVGGVLLDPYRIARAYGLEDHALFSALKKVLAAGRRGAKDKSRDVQDAIDALMRWQELEADDEPMTATEVDRLNLDRWTASREHLDGLAEDKRRMDAEQREAMEACLVTANAGKTVMLTTPGSELRWPMPDDPAARIAELESVVQMVADALPPQVLDDVPLALHDRVGNLAEDFNAARRRIAELARELREARHEASRERELTTEKVDMVRDLGSDLVGARRELAEVRKELSDLRETYDAEMEFRAEMRRELCARDDEGFPNFLRRVCAELSALRDRYRPRRQSEEPAPKGEAVLRWSDEFSYWVKMDGSNLENGRTWTHQPPAPSEGEDAA